MSDPDDLDTVGSVSDPETLTNEPKPPTESHALAITEQEVKGAAQLKHDAVEVKDLGWNDRAENVPKPLVGGLSNDELWLLLRRFNKQMYHVTAIEELPHGTLDLNIAGDEEFSPDKMRANFERLYMTVIVGMAALVKHIARLRSWKEQRRTTAFCVIYFLAWFLDLVMPTIFATILVLIIYPPSRALLFPPAPLALVDAKTGGLQEPAAGVLGSDGSLTGAPEHHKGEAVEQEASNLVTSIAGLALSGASGQETATRPEHVGKQDAGIGGVAAPVPDPTDLTAGIAQAQSVAASGASTAHQDKTKRYVHDKVWEQARPFMQILAEVSDMWERFGNALSPTSPFPHELSRLKVATLIAPAFLCSLVVTPLILCKGTTFALGFAFFGAPVIERGVALLNRKVPKWQRFLDLRNTVFRGIPTNAQLTLTLLRVGEASRAPLPPPPPPAEVPPPDAPAEHINAEELPLDVTQEQVDAAANTAAPRSPTKPAKRKSRFIGFVRTVVRTGVNAALVADNIRATVGAQHARQRLGILGPRAPAGPMRFPCRLDGRRGGAYIVEQAITPCIAFTYDWSNGAVFSVAISDIRELRKIGGLGWKARMLVGWAMDREVHDALEIVDVLGKHYILTAMQLRDELFNRLIAIGPQKWVAY